MTPRHVRQSLLAVAAALVLVAVAVVTPVLWLAWMDPFGGPRHPSDLALLEQFQRQRPALEAIVAMLADDPLVSRLAPDFTRPEPPPLTPARLADYRQRLAAAGIDRGLSRSGDEVFFIVSTSGLAIAGSAKGIAHSAGPLRDALVVDGDLDAAAAALDDKDQLLVRRVDEGWWLQLDMR